MLAFVRSRLTRSSKMPAVVHVTHAKAGSTWIANVLYDLFPGCVAPRGNAGKSGESFSERSFKPGCVYPALFLTRDQILAHSELRDATRFVVIRDPRDTLVSLYFSHRYSHSLAGFDQIRTMRDVLGSLSEEAGFAYLMEHHFRRIPAIQASWLGADELVLRYEDILKQQSLLIDLFLEKLRLPTSAAAISRALARNEFETVFKRKLGEVDEASHGRQGLPGDWKNHFTPALRREFHARYGATLISAGYEHDDRWVA
jgi:hypothetical protein